MILIVSRVFATSHHPNRLVERLRRNLPVPGGLGSSRGGGGQGASEWLYEKQTLVPDVPTSATSASSRCSSKGCGICVTCWQTCCTDADMDPRRTTTRFLLSSTLAATCVVMTLQASEPPTGISEELSSVHRFLSADNEPLRRYRAFRRLEAANGKFKKEAWLEAWTEVDAAGFRYDIVGEGGSEYIRDRVLRSALEREKAIWDGSLSGRSTLTTANYDFIAAGLDASGLMRVTVKPKRKDELLVDGVIILAPDTGDLLRVEGRLAKSPSFWTGQVEVVRTYDRIDGVRVPVRTESVAHVKMAGASSFAMSYQYETINGRRVGSPSVVASNTP
jgi:hypothetical protein